jgi:hypothetical protein
MNPAHKSLCAFRVGPGEETLGLDVVDALIVVFDNLAMSKSDLLRLGMSTGNQTAKDGSD